MREIVFDLTQDSYFPKIAFGGFEGEHNATKLILRLPERLIAADAVYYMVFETEKNDEVIFSAPLPLEGNAICTALPKQVMISPAVKVHGAAYRKQGEELIEIAKSPRVLLEIKYPELEMKTELSCDGGEIPGLVIEQSLLPESDNPVSSRALFDELSALEGEQVQSAYVNDNGELVLKKKNRSSLSAGLVIGPKGEKGDRGETGAQGEKGDKGDRGEADYSLVANALKGSASGEEVYITDISPLEHQIKVKLSAIPPTVETITALAGADSDIYKEDGDYVVNKVNEYDGAWDCAVAYLTDGSTIAYIDDYVEEISPGDIIRIVTLVSEDLETFQEFYLVKREQADPPEIDFTAVTLIGCGKNLLPYPYAETEKTINGITFTDHGDGTLTLNGTSTATIEYRFSLLDGFRLPAGKYVISKGNEKAAGYMHIGGTSSLFNRDVYGNAKFALVAPNTIGYCNYQIPKGKIFDNVTIRPQLQSGYEITEFEPYQKPVHYTPREDGTVEGVTSFYPTTVLVTDAKNVAIAAEYNKDFNKVIQRLESALISMGGEL